MSDTAFWGHSRSGRLASGLKGCISSAGSPKPRAMRVLMPNSAIKKIASATSSSDQPISDAWVAKGAANAGATVSCSAKRRSALSLGDHGKASRSVWSEVIALSSSPCWRRTSAVLHSQ